ncbi:very-long-chain enoyl-CoA reductase-like [Pecten maximus]|uniref:very-long-chain enoyl-CoA reductase-like n=1 Tax=Pecten maximus TaxID=6579 RepID=UPI00145870DD|nr:very-long-chain enoyl-CoA reductase-like [Pecten maximus]
MEITVLHPRSGKTLATLTNISTGSSISDVKREYEKKFPKYYPTRQAFKSDPKGKTLKDDVRLTSIDFTKPGTLYFKDLGPQVGWTTVFLTEYSGPLIAYLIFYARPAIIYGAAASQPRSWVVNLAAACFSFHYVKRLLETVFVHRFSNATMPIMNIFKNSTYYWGFAAFISYYINHPLYTLPTYGNTQVYSALAGFIFGELGNFSIHMAFRSLRPPGTKERRIPRATSNPFTTMFNFVSCPNYTYEVVSWISFSVMTQCFPALLFTTCGFYQMAVWALGKHRNYKKEFKDYPRNRKSIVPFLL